MRAAVAGVEFTTILKGEADLRAKRLIRGKHRRIQWRDRPPPGERGSDMTARTWVVVGALLGAAFHLVAVLPALLVRESGDLGRH